MYDEIILYAVAGENIKKGDSIIISVDKEYHAVANRASASNFTQFAGSKDE